MSFCRDELRDKELFINSAMSQQPTESDRLLVITNFKYQKNIRGLMRTWYRASTSWLGNVE